MKATRLPSIVLLFLYFLPPIAPHTHIQVKSNKLLYQCFSLIFYISICPHLGVTSLVVSDFLNFMVMKLISGYMIM